MVADELVGPNVADGQHLITYLDEDGYGVRSALWAFNPDTDVWRLWLTFDNALSDKREFYQKVGAIISDHRSELPGLDVGDVELVAADHPALTALRSFLRVEGFSAIRFTNNMFNGYFLPDAIVMRMT